MKPPVDAKESAAMNNLIEALKLFDRELPYSDFFKTHGDDLFTIVFRLTFYNDHELSVTNF